MSASAIVVQCLRYLILDADAALALVAHRRVRGLVAIDAPGLVLLRHIAALTESESRLRVRALLVLIA